VKNFQKPQFLGHSAKNRQNCSKTQEEIPKTYRLPAGIFISCLEPQIILPIIIARIKVLITSKTMVLQTTSRRVGGSQKIQNFTKSHNIGSVFFYFEHLTQTEFLV